MQMRAYNIPRSVTLSPGRIEEGWTWMRLIILLTEREADGVGQSLVVIGQTTERSRPGETPFDEPFSVRH